MKLSWSWGKKITEQLIWDGLHSVKHLLVGSLLDLGCGMKPYRTLSGENAARWIRLDYKNTPSGRSAADVFGSALDLPFRTATFDRILSTQVAGARTPATPAHPGSPPSLRPGGYHVLTALQTSPLHKEPDDYFRYTCHGLRYLAEQAGFRVAHLRPLGGVIATVGQLVVWHCNRVRRIPGIGPTPHKLVNAGLARTVLKLDRFSPVYGGGAMKDTLNLALGWQKDRATMKVLHVSAATGGGGLEVLL